ncbi:hypothetical protein BT96DRAFT_946323 [Gymnopus androsaceus JB14]|uniref:Uncharacterized protein n=1 Tax=Gymnopus androsaceus JB14 TaxID=1447944 RepID=A0A6A4GYW6_9AGAR|nr:hypothetical protein BT96DRAFT_946323 [Gymnopus androsaceus JB14]
MSNNRQPSLFDMGDGTNEIPHSSSPPQELPPHPPPQENNKDNEDDEDDEDDENGDEEEDAVAWLTAALLDQMQMEDKTVGDGEGIQSVDGERRDDNDLPYSSIDSVWLGLGWYSCRLLTGLHTVTDDKNIFQIIVAKAPGA